ncbi:5-methylcytosine-specific restriction endonuclease McrA [Gemmobacter caeni]|jgi:5-methylcytosine-specific restriction endonuclease McrA|uniref:5-methylcytosine-specific restriction endonuclease McrA n=1 Tax=Gemmobacter caeni TaxID=589035 RepID=A0A2T6B962_9RHOB|nr:HNH endonuclease [Gemmobacter caeni]PTX52604.1 5-methylcytosine-specific restriction endonuclease McrA [Gemmobacter caeni]TWI94939.1 5-methylcytosine-specific restriction endonuclease McrA [Gemmobacter caeni]
MSVPNYPALVLNADFSPVRIHPLSTWGFERVLRAVLKDRVVVLEEHDAELRSANLTYRPPSVIALRRYVRPQSAVPFNRMNIFLRDGFRCQYCGDQFDTRNLTFDHVIPRSRGGGTNFENIVSACAPCNSRKGSEPMRPLRQPRTPTPREMSRIARPDTSGMCKSWIDYLYWAGCLDED